MLQKTQSKTTVSSHQNGKSSKQNNHFNYYDGMEDDVSFWYEKYVEQYGSLETEDFHKDVISYIAQKIEIEHPTENPEQFESLKGWVRFYYNKINKYQQ